MMVLLGQVLLLVLAWVDLRNVVGLGEEEPITFYPKAVQIYDTKPKFRLKGVGFSQLSAQDLTQLKFDPPMVQGEVLAQAKVESDDIVLELAPGKIWPQSNGILELVGASLGDKELISSPITVAKVIQTPTVSPSNSLLYLQKNDFLVINGTNFNEKKTDLFFWPALRVDVDISASVRSSSNIVVTLLPKVTGVAEWADAPGPLKLVAIDTGAGKLLLREDLGGVTIAEMQVGTQGDSISLRDHEAVSMYQSTKVLTIAGTGFNPDHTKFSFGYTPLKEGQNFTSVSTDYSSTLTLMEGSKWRLNKEMLPGPLVLLAVDAGQGFMPLGSTLAKSGVKVATVYEDPSLEESHAKIGRTLTHELYLKGSGFTDTFPPMIMFEPPIDRDNYIVQVMNRTAVKITLAGEGKGWMPEGQTGNLSVSVINTGGGMFAFNKSVPIATVVADEDPHHTGIKIKPSYNTQRYQSSNVPLVIDGEGFPAGASVKLTFGFGGPKQESFSCKSISDTKLEVTLVDGHTWADKGGPLFLQNATFGELEVTGPSAGIVVATILDDPLVVASQLQVYASHTRHITIQGRGFSSAFNIHEKPKLELSPTKEGHFFIKDGDWTDETITISLTGAEDARWADVGAEGETVNIKVTSVNTGAGSVSMPGGGIVVAEVRMDDAAFSCEDSCVYANDGECDEYQIESEALNWVGYMTMAESGGETTSQASTGRARYGRAKRNVGSGTAMEGGDDLALEEPSCPMGTDCTDCGLEMVKDGMCTNTCKHARDGVCDDRRRLGVCHAGTDCQDCGPWGQSNFTQPDYSGSSVEESINDDMGFLASDNHPMLEGQRENAYGPFKRTFVKHKKSRKESDKAEGLFMEILYAAIILVGGSVTVYLMVLVVRCVKGENIDIQIPTNPDVEHTRR